MPDQSSRWKNARPKTANATLKGQLPVALQTAIANEDLGALRTFIQNQLSTLGLTSQQQIVLERLFALCLLTTFEKTP